jgi:hypothetical protein
MWVIQLTSWYPRRCSQRPAKWALKLCMLDAFTESAFCQHKRWNTSVCAVTRLRAGQRRNHDSIPGTTKGLSPHSQSPERFWHTPTFLCHGYWEAPVPGGKEGVAWKEPVIHQSIAKTEKEWGWTSTLTYACTGTTLLHLFYMLSYLQ